MKLKRINYKTSERLEVIGMFVGIMVMAAGQMNSWISVVGFLICIAAAVQGMIFCRCPKCGKGLMRRFGGIPDRCPKCYHILRNGK